MSAPRTSGPPPSANGASSFHLWWELTTRDPLLAVAAVLEVRMVPQVWQLYFWALQASFHDGTSSRGAGHLGLQWAAAAPPVRSVNWGGYDADGGVLAGTASGLPSTSGNPNTRDYPWREGRPYRLRIGKAPDGSGAWRGEVAEVGSTTVTVVRDLFAPAPYLAEPVVWSEVFADCDAPSTAVRWSELEAQTASGRWLKAPAVTVGYQRHSEGGCDNTTAVADDTGVLQVTNAERTTAAGSRLLLE